MKLRGILSLSTVFPLPAEPAHGIFVERRLQALARLLPVRVVAPVAWIAASEGRLRLAARGVPRRLVRGALRIEHPRWLYAPGLGATHAWCLAAALAGELRRLEREEPFDLIDAHFGYPEGAAACRLARRLGKPFAITLRGSELVHAASPARRAQMQEALRSAAAVIAVSRELGEFAVRLGAAPERCAVIGNGVDTAVFHPRPREAARARLGMAPDRIHILSAGHLIALKGHHRLAALLPALHAAGVPADLWIIGTPGRDRGALDEIRRTVESLRIRPFVHLMGAVSPEQLADYMSACDLFCLASTREGWPNVVHEAMACGAPVVATRVGAVEDMIPGEEFGIVVPPGDDAALLGGILRALQRRFDRGAIARHAAARSWERVAQEVYDLFDTVPASCVSGRP